MEDRGICDFKEKHIAFLKEFIELDHLTHLDQPQKASIQLSIGGYENSGYFHGTITPKRHQMAIRGVLHWLEEPRNVKEKFRDYYRSFLLK